MDKKLNNDLQFLSKGGEMGKIISEKNWDNTNLGKPELWPQSLKTTLSIILNSRFPMFLLWGPELICFYNDAYRPSLGKVGRHPEILGGKAEIYWKEIWKDIKPIIDQVLGGGDASWDEDLLLAIYRNGKMEDAYWTFSFSAVHDESEEPAGVFITCSETTDKVLAFKRLNEVSQRYYNNIMTAPVAMCVLRGPDFIVEIANQLMLELWGKQASEVMDKPIFIGLSEAKNQGLEVFLEKVYTTGEKFEANERPVKLPRNGSLETTYVNFVYEPLRELDGTISGIVAAATEVTAQVISRKKVEEGEHKLRAVIDNAPFAIAVYVGEEMRIEMANESIINIWGKGNEVIGKTFTEVLPELSTQLVFDQIKNVFITGVSFHTESTPLELIVDGRRATYYFNYSFTPLYDLSGKIYGVMNTGIDLTDLNLVKKQIEEADKKFRNTVKQAPVGITILRGPEYVVEMANDSYLELVGRSENEFIGRPLFESLPEVQASVHTILDGVTNTGIAYHGNEVPIPLNRNGCIDIGHFDFLYHPLKEEDDTITGIIVTVTEVTEKVESRKRIEENEERLSIVVAASELGTWELNLKTNEAIYSKKYLEILGGYKEDILLTHDILIEHLHPEDVEIRNNAMKIAIEKGNLDLEVRLIWNDGSIHWMQAKGKVFYDSNKEAEKIIGTIREITEEKNRQQELVENERKFRLLADSMPQNIWTSDTEGNLNYFNKSVYDFTGLTPAEIAAKGWLQIVHPDDRKANISLWNHAIKTGEDYIYEHRFRRHDGTYRWQLSRAIPQMDDKGAIQMWVGTSTDIQEQKIFANELENQVLERTRELAFNNEELEKMNKELQSFAYISSHDLQEPLRKIQTFSSQILEKEFDNLSELGRMKFERMRNAAERMQTLINDLLAYSRTNIQERKFEVTDLNFVIDEVKNDLKEELLQKNATIKVEDICDINIIPFQFRQLIFNLVSNALKFAKEESDPVIQIKCRTEVGEVFNVSQLDQDKRYCHLSIADNGIGFDQQYAERIFEVFQRLHGKGEYSGTGIGLAIVKKIVENHHGVIIANGVINVGARFDIYLPVKED